MFNQAVERDPVLPLRLPSVKDHRQEPPTTPSPVGTSSSTRPPSSPPPLGAPRRCRFFFSRFQREVARQRCDEERLAAAGLPGEKENLPPFCVTYAKLSKFIPGGDVL